MILSLSEIQQQTETFINMFYASSNATNAWLCILHEKYNEKLK